MTTAKQQPMTADERRSVACEYFKRLDDGADVLELFAEDAELHFPKWGAARGHAAMQRMLSDVGRLLGADTQCDPWLSAAGTLDVG